MTIDQLAVLMSSFGIERAMNLDGGGSTTMWVKGQGVVNVPSDGVQRVVANHLGVFATGKGELTIVLAATAPGSSTAGFQESSVSQCLPEALFRPISSSLMWVRKYGIH